MTNFQSTNNRSASAWLTPERAVVVVPILAGLALAAALATAASLATAAARPMAPWPKSRPSTARHARADRVHSPADASLPRAASPQARSSSQNQGYQQRSGGGQGRAASPAAAAAVASGAEGRAR